MGNKTNEITKELQHPKLGKCQVLDNIDPPLLEHNFPIKNAQ
jgi:hypothetical protein